MKFLETENKSYTALSLITEYTSVHMNINTGLPLLFLLIKLTPVISISSVTEVSVFLRRLYSTEVFNSVCVKSRKNF